MERKLENVLLATDSSEDEVLAARAAVDVCEGVGRSCTPCTLGTACLLDTLHAVVLLSPSNPATFLSRSRWAREA